MPDQTSAVSESKPLVIHGARVDTLYAVAVEWESLGQMDWMVYLDDDWFEMLDLYTNAHDNARLDVVKGLRYLFGPAVRLESPWGADCWSLGLWTDATRVGDLGEMWGLLVFLDHCNIKVR